MQNLKKVQNCADILKSLLPHDFSPDVGLILGTGLGNIASLLASSRIVPYRKLPDMPVSTVQSHQGVFVAGTLSGIPVLLQQGRSHLYEGATPADICMGVRVMATLGIRALVITNVAGALNPLFKVGSLMAITDHINMTGQSPLTG
ncbi:MAG: purine-nucleoside phosphorylase, partial [Planctomycetes bacterium]|nr:purine-nucleoside phosphorylase [Planctomycetota bacterium]